MSQQGNGARETIRHDTPDQEDVLTLEVRGRRDGSVGSEGYQPIELATDRGPIAMRLTKAGGPTGVICVGGAGGGWDSPVRGRLYPWLADELPEQGVSLLRVRFRDSHHLEEATLDVMAGIEVLAQEGVERVALIGHSFGGAVVISAAAADERVVACCTLATQSYGASSASILGPHCALLLVHGTADRVLPDRCSRSIHAMAQEPKELWIHKGSDHGLDEWEDELPDKLKAWLLERLGVMYS